MSWCFGSVGALGLIGRTVVMSACEDRGVRGGADGVDEGGGGGTDARAIWSGGRDGRDDGAGGGAGRDGACTELVGRSVECGVGGDDIDGEDGEGAGLTTVLSLEMSLDLAKLSSYPRLIKIGRSPLASPSTTSLPRVSGLVVAAARSG